MFVVLVCDSGSCLRLSLEVALELQIVVVVVFVNVVVDNDC